MVEHDLIWSLYRGAILVGVAGVAVVLFWRSLSPDINEQGKRRLMWMVTVAFCIKVGLILVWYARVGGLYIDPSVQDQRVYILAGEYIATQIRDGMLLASVPPYLESAAPGFYYVVGVLYAVLGESPVAVSLFNTFLSVAVSMLVYKIVYSFSDHRAARIALLLNLAYPQYVSASYFVLKDMVITFLVVGTAWSLYCVRRIPVKLALLFGFVVCLTFFRLPLAFLVGLLAALQLLALALPYSSGFKKALLPLMTGSALLVAVLLVVSPGGRSIRDVGYTTAVTAYHTEAAGYLQGQRLTVDWQGLVGIIQAIGSAPKTFVYHSIESIFHVFWGPPHFYSRSGPTLYPYSPSEPPFRALLEGTAALLLSLLMPMIAYGLFRCVKVNWRLTLLLYALPLSLTAILILTGNIVRWRLPMMPFLLAFGALGLQSWSRIRPFYPLYVMGFNIVVMVNASLNQSLAAGISTTFATCMCLALAVVRRGSLKEHMRIR